MSWDVLVFHLREKPRSLEELQEDSLLPLGSAEQVRAAISAALRTVDWSDPAWGLYSGDGFSIEFSVGREDPVQSIMLHVRGGGDAIKDIMKVVVPSGWAALDCSTSEFLDPDDPSDAGWVGFQEYRDKMLREIDGNAQPDE